MKNVHNYRKNAKPWFKGSNRYAFYFSFDRKFDMAKMLDQRDFTNGQTFKETNFDVLRKRSDQNLKYKKNSTIQALIDGDRYADSPARSTRSKFSQMASNSKVKGLKGSENGKLFQAEEHEEAKKKSEKLNIQKDQLSRPRHRAGEDIKDEHILIPISNKKLNQYRKLSKNNLDM